MMSMRDQAQNLNQVAKGTMKEAAGIASTDEPLAVEGKNDQTAANQQQAVEKVKDAFGE